MFPRRWGPPCHRRVPHSVPITGSEGRENVSNAEEIHRIGKKSSSEANGERTAQKALAPLRRYRARPTAWRAVGSTRGDGSHGDVPPDGGGCRASAEGLATILAAQNADALVLKVIASVLQPHGAMACAQAVAVDRGANGAC